MFSSYPGTIFSGDDFYILSSGLVSGGLVLGDPSSVPLPSLSPPSPQVALETTIGNNNPARWKYLDPQGSVLEWLRNIVANRLARSGPEWATIFRQFNSGT